MPPAFCFFARQASPEGGFFIFAECMTQVLGKSIFSPKVTEATENRRKD
jgi:hypothetical protein